MKCNSGRKPSLLLCFFAFLFLLLSAGNSLTQTTASDWLKKGLNASSAAVKIEAFEKAVAMDPDYIEAYFYLGLAYKNAARFNDAEIALGKAYYKNPYALNDDIKIRILLELGAVQGALGKTEEARETYLAAKKLNGGSPPLKGKVLYELGRIYLQLQQYDLAIDELRAGKVLLPENESLFEKAIAEARQKKMIDSKYAEGLSHLQAQRYPEAVSSFESVVALDADYMDVQAKLVEAQKGVASSRQQTKARIVRPNTKPPKPQPQSRENRVTEKVVQNYRRGVAALQRKDWTAAVQAFTSVAQRQRDYRDVQALLTQARDGLRSDAKKEEKSKQLYEQGMAHIAGEEWRSALSAFKELRSLNPNYRDIEAELTKIKMALSERQTSATIDSTYQSGVAAWQDGEWSLAVQAFENVQAKEPHYKDVEQKLADAKFNLSRKTERVVRQREASGSRTIVWVGATVALFLLPAVGLLIFVPGLRAHLLLLQGKYDRAAQVYEQILQKRPEKVKLYPILGNIYLLEDRRDENAIKIFETILKLNILANKRDEITSIVANYYMRNKRTDGRAIAIMERELNNKINSRGGSAV